MGNYLCEQVQKSPPVTRPLERVEIDHTKLPLFVVSSEQRMPIGRPWLTAAIDKYSGVIVGYYLGFDPPSYLSVMQCLKNLIEPKSLRNFSYLKAINSWDVYGLPEVIVVDNGQEFYSTHFEDACLSLGIMIQYSPPKMPWYKGAIERYFGSLNSQLLSEKPGKILANLFNLSDYNAQENAVISFEALSEIIYLFIVDIYNQSSHPEFGSPRSEVWSKGIALFPPALPSNKEQLSILIGQIAWRKISRRGLEFEGLIYNSSELARLRSQGQDSQMTKIKYDPTNLALIYVFDEGKQQFLEVPALNQDYTLNLTLWQHKIIKKLARLEGEKVDIVALALAKEKIQKLVAQEWKKTKKGKTKQTLARWLGLGRDDFLLPKEEEASEILGGNLGNISLNSSQVNPLVNLSEVGNALTLVETETLEAVPECLSRKNQTIDQSLNQKKQEQLTGENAPKEQLKISEEFEPNLLGWMASYGLPKSPTKL